MVVSFLKGAWKINDGMLEIRLFVMRDEVYGFGVLFFVCLFACFVFHIVSFGTGIDFMCKMITQT